MGRGRPGRKRKAGPRHRCGKLVQVATPGDRGTAELVARRARISAGADPALSTCPVDAMLARGLIGPDQVAAAATFAWAHRVRVPPRLCRPAPSLDVSVPSRDAAEPSRDAEALDHDWERQAMVWRRLASRLTRAEIAALVDLTVMSIWPAWLGALIDRVPLGPADRADRVRTLAALAKLTEIHRGMTRYVAN